MKLRVFRENRTEFLGGYDAVERPALPPLYLCSTARSTDALHTALPEPPGRPGRPLKTATRCVAWSENIAPQRPSCAFFANQAEVAF